MNTLNSITKDELRMLVAGILSGEDYKHLTITDGDIAGDPVCSTGPYTEGRFELEQCSAPDGTDFLRVFSNVQFDGKDICHGVRLADFIITGIRDGDEAGDYFEELNDQLMFNLGEDLD